MSGNRGPFAKVYRSMWDGSLGQEGDAWPLMVFMIAHADADGIVNIDPRAIAGRCGWTLDRVRAGLAVLEAPDPESRSPGEDGRRLVRLDDHRTWGWQIVNYAQWRNMTPTERVAAHRARKTDGMERDVTPGNALSHEETRRNQVEVEVEVEGEVETKPVLNPTPRAPRAEPATLIPVDRTVAGTILSVNGEDVLIYADEVERWQKAYPALKVGLELARIDAWCRANPSNRKTAGGMRRFVVRWLGRAQDHARPGLQPAGARAGADARYLETNREGEKS